MLDFLKSLNKNELTVLYYKCKGWKYNQIAGRLGYSSDWVQLQMSTVYTKLKFDKSMHWTKRVEILEKDICPNLPKDIENWKFKEEISATEEPKTQPKADPEMLALVLYDEKQLVAINERSVIPIKEEIVIPPPPKKISYWRVYLILFVVAVLLGVVGYFSYNLGKRNTLVPVVIVVTATPLPATDTPVFTSTPVSTDTSLPTLTATPLPTSTAIPTATTFIPPEDGVLFEDTFDSQINPSWTQSFGTWLIADGRVTILPNEDSYSDDYQLLTLKQLGWNNYIVSVDVLVPDNNNNDATAVVVRTSGAKEIGFSTNWEPAIALAFISTGYNDTERIASDRDSVDFPEGISTKVEIEVQNDTYVLRFNGREIQRITLTGYNKSLIQLGAYCLSSYPGCPSFDNVRVIYLP